MRKTELLFLVFVLAVGSMNLLDAQTTVEVKNNGFSFSPDEVKVSPGDTINFDIGSSHDAVEVSEETWNANDNILNGGFSLPLGGGKLVIEEPGTYYFVCSPHAQLGMKGIIYVQSPSSIISNSGDTDLQLKVFPNPTSQSLTFSFTIEKTTRVKIELVDIAGRLVRILENGIYQAGIYTESFNLENLQPGRYLLHMQTDSQRNVEQVFIID